MDEVTQVQKLKLHHLSVPLAGCLDDDGYGVRSVVAFAFFSDTVRPTAAVASKTATMTAIIFARTFTDLKVSTYIVSIQHASH